MPDRSDTIDVRLICLFLCLLVGSTLVACSSSPTTEPSPTTISPLAQSPLPTPASDMEAPTLEVPLPESGKASVGGVLYTYTGHGPIPGTTFYLTLARGDAEPRPPAVFTGPEAEAGDILGTSDEGGWISLNNIPPGKYYLAVWAPYNWIIADESDVDRTPRLITLEADQQLDLGRIYLSWP